MITIKRFFVCMLALLLVCVGCMYWIYNSQQVKANHLQQEANALWNYKLNEPSLREQIVKLENDNTKLKQDVAFHKGKFESDELYIDYVNGQYLKAISWINIAELIFENNNVVFPLYLGDRELKND